MMPFDDFTQPDPPYQDDWVFDMLHERGALVIDEDEFDVCRCKGFEMDLDKIAQVTEEARVKKKGAVAARKRINTFCVVVRVGANGPAPGTSGSDAVLIDPTLSNCFIIAVGGNGAAGAAGPVPAGPAIGAPGVGAAGGNGGDGGRCPITVDDCNVILAIGGTGAVGGAGATLPGQNIKGGDGGDGGRGGGIVLSCQGNNNVILVAGNGGNGGNGGDGGTLAQPSAADGGNAGDGREGGTINLFVQASDAGIARSGDGGTGSRGGRGIVNNRRGVTTSGGDGGDGGDAGDINGGITTRIRRTLGSLGTAGDGGVADPIFLSFLLGGSKGTDGRPGSLN